MTLASYLLRKRVKFPYKNTMVIGELVVSTDAYVEVRTCMGVRAYNRSDIGPILEVQSTDEAERLEKEMRACG